MIAPDRQVSAEQPGAVPWTVRDIWIGLAALAAWFVLYSLSGYLLTLSDENPNLGLYVTFGEAFLLLPVWWFAFRKYRGGLALLGYRRFRGVAIALGCGFQLMVYGFNLVYSLLLALLNVSIPNLWVDVFQSAASPWLLFLSGVIVAPIVEETFFRGFLFPALRQRIGWVWAMLTSSFVFSMMHLQLLGFLPIFLLGCSLAFLRHYSRSLWPPIIIHMFSNLVGLGAAYFLAFNGLPPAAFH